MKMSLLSPLGPGGPRGFLCVLLGAPGKPSVCSWVGLWEFLGGLLGLLWAGLWGLLGGLLGFWGVFLGLLLLPG